MLLCRFVSIYIGAIKLMTASSTYYSGFILSVYVCGVWCVEVHYEMQRQCCGMKLEVEERRDGATARERHRDTERERG